jgi:two-component system, cell cycle sensor histidine kinase and response regulator CckA
MHLLAEAEATIDALLSGQIDAVVDPKSKSTVLLSRAQDALRESEDRYRRERDSAQRYLDTAAVIMLALDASGRITLANRQACSTLGWTAAELLGRDWFEMCIPDDMRATARASFRALLAGDLSTRENAVLTRNDGQRLIEWRNTLLRDDAGVVVGTFSSGTDVTEHHQTALALRVANERVRFALETANVGIWDMDYRTGELRWSETLEAQYGLPPGGFSGRFEDFIAGVHADDRAGLAETLRAATESGSDFTTLHRVLLPNAAVRWLSGTGCIQLDEEGEPVRGVGISLDVTDRHLTEERSQQAQKMEAVGRLASGIAHDFNNLLTVILGFADFMAEDVTPTSQHGSDLAEITKAARRARSLTMQLLAFSRQQLLQPTAIDVNDLIAEMTGMFEPLLGERIVVSLSPGASVPFARADRSQLEQIVMNLVVNAGDAMPAGGRVTISTADVLLADHFDDDDYLVVPGHYVMIAVTDTGTGMTSETRRRLFEPFFTTKPAGEGTGLGLSTTYGIVKQSLGHIRVSSVLNEGTTFEVYMPRWEGPLLPAANNNGPAVAPARALTGTLLLVEDEEGVRTLCRRILARAGYRVLEASNAYDAERLYLLHAASIDLVLTDIVMPGRGGPVLMRRLRRNAPDVKALYMSGYTDQTIPSQVDSVGDLNLLHKPFEATELLERVREAITR